MGCCVFPLEGSRGNLKYFDLDVNSHNHVYLASANLYAFNLKIHKYSSYFKRKKKLYVHVKDKIRIEIKLGQRIRKTAGFQCLLS